ncbi:MAG: GGDEF domain-containing protein [Planctomycetota bacterium]|nr:GGDEF domain-containing protein [Planctomycetota bacterium]
MTPPDHLPPDPATAQATPPVPAAGGAEGGAEDEVARLRARLAAVEDEVARLRGIVRQARDIIVTTDLEGGITEFNEEAEQVLGWSASEVLGQSADRFYVNKRARTRLIERLKAEPSGVGRDDVEVRTKSGERRWLNLSLSWLTDAAGARVGTIGVSKDVTKRRQLEEELRRLSVSDKLTGLFNQSHFFHRLEVEKERAIRLKHDLSLLYFDLDHFKQLNDSLGHREGDQVLVQIGRILFESIRKEVDSAFRYGGDEFTVLLPGADAAQAMRFAERVRLRIEGQDMHGVRASMGICPFDVENRALQLVEKADEAMYVAKRSGGNCIAVYDLAAGKATVCPVPDPSTGQHRRPAKV